MKNLSGQLTDIKKKIRIITEKLDNSESKPSPKNITKHNIQVLTAIKGQSS